MFEFDYYDNYHLEKQRTYLSKGYKWYNERRHLYYEFKKFYSQHNLLHEWERFEIKFKEEDRIIKKEKKEAKRLKMEMAVFDILWVKRGGELFQDSMRSALIDLIRTMNDRKLKYHIRKNKQSNRPKKKRSKTRTKQWNELKETIPLMIPKLRDYTEAEIVKNDFECSSKARKVTKSNIVKIINYGNDRGNPEPYIEAALFIINRHKKYNEAPEILESIKAKYPQLFNKIIDQKWYNILKKNE